MEPSADDLRAIARFIRARVDDEYRASGGLDYYLEQGVTIKPKFPRGYAGYRDSAEEYIHSWLESHSPRQQLKMASAMSGLAEELTRATAPGTGFAREMAWRELLKAAQVWREHPDFAPAWEQGERNSQPG